MTFLILILFSLATYTSVPNIFSPKFKLSKLWKMCSSSKRMKNHTPCSQQVFDQNKSYEEHEGTRINFEMKIYQTQMNEIVNQSERLYRKQMCILMPCLWIWCFSTITWFFYLARSLRMFSWYSFQEKVRSLHMWGRQNSSKYRIEKIRTEIWTKIATAQCSVGI